MVGGVETVGAVLGVCVDDINLHAQDTILEGVWLVYITRTYVLDRPYPPHQRYFNTAKGH